MSPTWYHPNNKNYFQRAGLIEVEEEPKVLARRSKEEVQGFSFLSDNMKRKFRILKERREARQTICSLERGVAN